ncbi:MAG: hypothetical protein II472_01840, partial [Lachnospiraceae bacterium]|nr:hypothetical protein [Lachnospiraceae bacterium]
PRKLHSKNSNDRKKIKTGKTVHTKKHNASNAGSKHANGSRTSSKNNTNKNSKHNGGSKPKNKRKR